jgi:hypothetical protein
MGESRARDAARAELARRYLAAYGPAGPEDLAAWSSLSLSEARAGFEAVSAELLEVDIGGTPGWVPAAHAAWLDEPQAAGLVVRLLPSFDPYLLGFRNRNLAVPQQYGKRVHPGGGVLRPTLLVDGCAAGTWKAKRRRGGLLVTVEPFADLGAEIMRALEDEVLELGCFLEVSATLTVATANG